MSLGRAVVCPGRRWRSAVFHAVPPIERFAVYAIGPLAVPWSGLYSDGATIEDRARPASVASPLPSGICLVPCLLPVLPECTGEAAALFPLFWSAGFPSFTGEGKTHQTI